MIAPLCQFRLKSDFIDTYGTVGYFLRNLDINTTSRVAMLSSLIHLQSSDEYVKFDDFYEFALKQTGEKLEKSSFNTLRSKLNTAIGSSDLIELGEVDDDDAYRASTELLKLVNEAGSQFSSLIDKI